MTKKIPLHVLAAAFAALCCLPARGGEAADEVKPYFHHPAVSAGGLKVAFCHQGDIWVADRDGGNIRRVTDHGAYDTRPVFSPDSTRIAFSSDREGSMDVFVVPLSGGPPTRLTHHSASDRALAFHPKGDAVAFLSRRDTMRHRIYSVPVAGGEPSVFLPVAAPGLTFSPDGTKVAFPLGAMHWWRRGYKGAGNFDIWVRKIGGPKGVKITSWEGNDTDPMWGKDGNLYFVSDRDGTANLWKADPAASGKAKQLTFHKRHTVCTPALSPDGRWVAYASLDGGIFLLDLSTGKTRLVPLEVVTDAKVSELLRETFTDKADELALSPDGKDLAFTVRGDLFVVSRKGGKARRVTDGPARESAPAWTPDSKALLFVSDRSGNSDIYSVTSDEEGKSRLSKARYFRTESLVSTPAREESPLVSPDGKSFVYLEGMGDLKIASLEEEPEKSRRWGLVAKGPLVGDLAWSCDSRWIAYSKAEKDWNSEVYIVSAAEGGPVNVTKDPDDDMEPLFGPKGEYLYFSSSRGGGERFDIHRIPLTLMVKQRDKEEEKEKEEEGEEEEEKEESGEKEGDKEKKEGNGEEEEEKEVKIDFAEIEDRAQRVTSTRGNDSMPVVDSEGETLYFKSNNLGHFEIWKSNADGSALARLTRGRQDPEDMVWSKEKKELVYRTGGTLRALSADGNAQSTVPYRAKMEIHLPSERREVFDEAWRALKDYFYDPGMHGVDWAKARSEYRPFAVGCSRTEDFNDIFSMMLGELNASHLGIYGPGGNSKPEITGYTGITFVAGREGKRFVVAKVLKDSPADREESKVDPGEFLVSVNRKEVRAGENLSAILNGTVGEKVDFEFALSEDGPVKRRVTLKPVNPSASSGLLYEAWVDARRERVEKASGGRLGYVHIRWMSRGAFSRFRREYLAKVREKEGLVLDVRNNPGGYIHNQLWESSPITPGSGPSCC
jgi:tricorn protease